MDLQVLILDYVFTERAGMILLLSSLIFFVFQQNKSLNAIESELSKVVGKINKGDRLISSDVPGVAWALGEENYDPRGIIGRSLENKEDGNEGVIEAVIGVK